MYSATATVSIKYIGISTRSLLDSNQFWTRLLGFTLDFKLVQLYLLLLVRSEAMSETEHLLKKRPKVLLPLADVYEQLQSSSEGLTSEKAKEIRENIGINYIKPPIWVPEFLCCLLPCLLRTDAMKLYNTIIPDFGYVKRNKKWIRLDSMSIVPGDIVRIGTGEYAPADCRIISRNDNCTFDSSAVIGRSGSGSGGIPECVESAEQYLESPDMIYTGYLCTSGDCLVIVVATGANTLLSELSSSGAWPPVGNSSGSPNTLK